MAAQYCTPGHPFAKSFLTVKLNTPNISPEPCGYICTFSMTGLELQSVFPCMPHEKFSISAHKQPQSDYISGYVSDNSSYEQSDNQM